MHYEMLFILPGTLGEEETKPLIERVEKIVASNGGKELAIEDMGKNRLAYPMKHIRYGYFQLAHFQAEPKDAVEIQKKLALSSDILRVLVQKYNPKKQVVKRINYFSAEAPSAVQPSEAKPEAAKDYKIKESKPEEKAERAKKPAEKVSMEDIDKKLDEILQMDVNI